MGTDLIEEICSTVREVFESPSGDMCATFAVVGNPDAWVQVMKGTINSAYPRTNAPDNALLQLLTSLPEAAITSWEAEKFVTIDFQTTDPRHVAKAVDVLLGELFDVSDYSVDCALQEL
jgi:hypothetical protein